MKKNSVSLKEVLTLAARAIFRARNRDIVASARHDVIDARENRTQHRQLQRNAIF